MRFIGYTNESLADITSVVAGTGMTGGATSGAVTLNVVGGTGITANANDITVTANQTSIVTLQNAGLKIGRDANTNIDFATTDNKIFFKVNSADQLVIVDGGFLPRINNDIDLGTASAQFKDAYFDGTVTSDAFAGPLTGSITGDVDGSVSGSAGTVTTIGNLTGEVTSSNRATTIANDAVTYAKMQNLGTANRVLGATSTGDIGEVQIVEAMIADSSVAVEKLSESVQETLTTNSNKNTNVVTNLSVASSTGSRIIASSDGTNATIPIATTSVSGVMSTAIFDEHTANNAKITDTKTACFEFTGYSTGDGTNYEMQALISTNTAPFNHTISTGSDGLDAQTINAVIRTGGTVMPYGGAITAFRGWATNAGSGTVDIGIFRFRPTDNTAGDLTPVLMVNEQITSAGNSKMRSFAESSFSAGVFNAGDILFSAIKGGVNNKTAYFTSTVEVRWS